MTKTFEAVFDGEVLRPTSPLDLDPNKSYKLSIEIPSQTSQTGDAWDVLEAMAGSVEAPRDWSARHGRHL